MSAPKVSQTTEDVSLLGRRDAFHVPGVLVKSHDFVLPGGSVRFTDAACTQVEPVAQIIRHAIADPFVPGTIPPGSLFWAFIIPEMAANLVHHFDVTMPTPPVAIPEIVSPVAEPEAEDDEDDSSCSGCYGDEDDDEDDDACKGCYT